MKYIILLFVFTFSFQLVLSQDWNSSFEVAKQKSMETKNPIMLVFQGSDWCAPCIKLEKNIWQTDEFVNYANDNLILIKADFPRKKANRLSEKQQEHNNALAEKYNREGYFPYVVLMDATGKVKGSFGYHKWSPNEYIDYIKTLR